VLIVEGLHVPFIGVLFDDVVGSKEGIAFKQYEVVIEGKVIVLLVCGFTVTVIVCGVPAHWSYVINYCSGSISSIS